MTIKCFSLIFTRKINSWPQCFAHRCKTSDSFFFMEKTLCLKIILDIVPYETAAIKILPITSFSSGKNY